MACNTLSKVSGVESSHKRRQTLYKNRLLMKTAVKIRLKHKTFVSLQLYNSLVISKLSHAV